jgi:hypothetical protein
MTQQTLYPRAASIASTSMGVPLPVYACQMGDSAMISQGLLQQTPEVV